MKKALPFVRDLNNSQLIYYVYATAKLNEGYNVDQTFIIV